VRANLSHERVYRGLVLTSAARSVSAPSQRGGRHVAIERRERRASTFARDLNLASAQITSNASTAAEILSDASITTSGAITVDAGLTTDTVPCDVIANICVARSAHYQNYALARLANVSGGVIALGATVSEALVDGGVRATLNVTSITPARSASPQMAQRRRREDTLRPRPVWSAFPTPTRQLRWV